MKLSVLIIAHNEAHNIEDALASVDFADESIVVDNCSDDNTDEFARKAGAKVISTSKNIGYSDAKRLGLKNCSGDWVLWLDADERISKELAREIQDAIAAPGKLAAYEIPRKSLFIRRWMHHCGWYPDYIVRLFRRESVTFSDDLVHEKAIIEGKKGRMKFPIMHYSYPSLEEYFRKLNRYTTLAANQMIRDGKHGKFLDILMRPPATFIKMYLIKLGFLDGLEGFILSCLSSMYVLVKYAKAYYIMQEDA